MDTPTSLAVFKALGDNTRYAIYLELVRSPHPLSTAEIAVELGLHVNTVRPHLERMREIGLLDLRVDAAGGVGRPQHRYGLAPEAPSLGLEPPAFPLAAEILLRAAVDAGLSADDLAEAAVEQGRVDREVERPVPDDEVLSEWGGSRRAGPAESAPDEIDVRPLVAKLAELGFDPAVVEDGASCTVAFGHCPFGELAAANPDLICAMHRGLIGGFLEGSPVAVRSFRALTDANGCQVDVVAHR